MNPLWATRLARLAFCAVLLVILVAGLRSDPVPEAFENQDKLHHWIGFACLTLSAWLAFPGVGLRWLALGSLLVSIGVELGQELLPLRTASMGDIAANVIGVLCGMAVVLVLRRLWPWGQVDYGAKAESDAL
ncbi:teicoplanin resistance protein VanZ [Pseudomonas sp. GCM10022186]|uniref:teicoplanin resistance protein VanZ n=1 Tax=Pseudomonas sp. GCM10022186 TaxID=3252650 RepID=UPI003623B6EB